MCVLCIGGAGLLVLRFVRRGPIIAAQLVAWRLVEMPLKQLVVLFGLIGSASVRF